MVRFGIIGVGNMGSGHTKSFAEGKVKDAKLVAVCDLNDEKLEAIDKVLPGLKKFKNATDMFKSGEIDAVIVATPHYFHPTLSMEAFTYKIHVMCEKPAGVYTKIVREMNGAAEKAAKEGVVFGMMFNQRTNCVYRKMREMVQNGDIGEITRTNWIVTNWFRPQAYYDSGDWRATWAGEGGGVLLNQCPHNLDLWQWICGMPSKVTAFCHEGKWHDIEVEDDVTAYVEYPNGATGVFVTSTADAPGTNRFEVTGDKGRLICDRENLYYEKLSESVPEFNKTNTIAFNHPKAEKIEVETDGSNEKHVGVLNAFVDKILGRGELVADGTEGINGVIISNAMHLSSWLGKTIELPLDEDLFYAELQKRVSGSRKKAEVKVAAVDLAGTY